MNEYPFVSAVLLAAGSSRRLGPGNKLLLPFKGKSIIRHSVENVLKTDINELVVVAGREIGDINHELRVLSVTVILNRNYQWGISSSIIAGIRAVSPLAEGALILLADQPNLRPETLNRFLHAFHMSGKRIITGRYDGTLGNPVLFHRTLFSELYTLRGDVGARALLKTLDAEKEEIDISNEEVFDLDTPEDYRRMKTLVQV